jgi:hypothetical protein
MEEEERRAEEEESGRSVDDMSDEEYEEQEERAFQADAVGDGSPFTNLTQANNHQRMVEAQAELDLGEVVSENPSQNVPKKKVIESDVPMLPSEIEMKKFEQIAHQVINAKLAPRGVDTVEKVMVILQTGRELGFTPMMSLNNIHVIEGRPTLGVHMVAALLENAGIDYETIKDYEPIYKDPETRSGLLDYETVIRFHKTTKNGRHIKEDVKFTYKDAVAAGLQNKSNWKSYPKQMCWNRCLIIGSRRVAPKALMGMYEHSELADVHNAEYSVVD